MGSGQVDGENSTKLLQIRGQRIWSSRWEIECTRSRNTLGIAICTFCQVSNLFRICSLAYAWIAGKIKFLVRQVRILLKLQRDRTTKLNKAWINDFPLARLIHILGNCSIHLNKVKGYQRSENGTGALSASLNNLIFFFHVRTRNYTQGYIFSWKVNGRKSSANLSLCSWSTLS